MVFRDFVSIRKALRALCRMLDGRAGGRRRGRPRDSSNEGSAGIVDGLVTPRAVGLCFYW